MSEEKTCKICKESKYLDMFPATGRTCSDCKLELREKAKKRSNQQVGARRHTIRASVNGESESFVSGFVFNRDKWLCGICGGKIDKFLNYPHPQSASLDHVMPIAKGGTHTLSNVQASHLVCNLSKGAK